MTSPFPAPMPPMAMPLGMPPAGNVVPMAPPAPVRPLPRQLQALLDNKNIAATLDDEQIAKIAAQVVDEYDIDKQSRSRLDEVLKDAEDLALLVAEKKTYPFDGASNVKYPLITIAALQFNARAYSAIVQGNRCAKCITFGKDPDGAKAARAERVAEHLSYDLLAKMPEWEEDTDRLTAIISVDGSIFRKVFYDPAVKRKVSRLIRASRLVVNYWARSLDDVPRITEELDLYPYEIAERVRAKRFIEFDYDNQSSEGTQGDDKEGNTPTHDPDGPQLFLEQHRLLDLDGDGYPEPYVATVHKESGKLCRLVANFTQEGVTLADDGSVASIRRETYYVKYIFLPSLDGSFYGLGFGWLLKSTNESINTTLNQMFDAGHMANMQGGFISGGLGLRDKSLTFKRGEFKVLQSTMPINQAIMPLKFDGPSAVLFNLLGMLVETGKELASVKDVLTGDTPATAPVGTTLAMIEQGLTQFTTIYKRLHRSLKTELGLMGKLNRKHVTREEYVRFHDDPSVDPAVDYADDDMDILPVSDPQSVTKMQKIAKGQALMQVEPPDDPAPVLDKTEKTRRVLEALEIEDIDKLIKPPQPPDPMQQQLLMRGAEAEVAVKEHTAEKLQAETGAILHKAETEGATPEADPFEQQHAAIMAGHERDAAVLKNEGLRIDNQNKLADLKTKDVTVKEDGSVESKTETGLQMLGEMVTQLGMLIAQQGQATQMAIQSGNERLATIMAAPVVPIKDDKGNLVGAQKVLN